LAIVENGRCRGEITSEKTFWEGRDQPSTRVGILSTLKEDIYLNLAGWENTTAQLHLQRFALVSWIWAGSWVMYFGVLVALLGDMKLNVKGKQVKLWPRQMR
jgi:cytochrome c-type biogenesis protein CcmF